MKYRIRWKLIETREGFVNDGDQDGDAWEGDLDKAEELVKRLEKQDENFNREYIIVPASR